MKLSTSMIGLFKELETLLNENLTILSDKIEENVQNTLCALWLFVSGKPFSLIDVDKEDLVELDPQQVEVLRDLISKRLKGVPLAYLIKNQNFMGINLLIDEGVYIPRKETELLGSTVNKIISNDFKDKKIKVIDICTGIGTLAIAIAYYNKNNNNLTVIGSDISTKQIALAKKNAKALELDRVVSFLSGDLMEPLQTLNIKGKVDIVLSAPPYISSSKIAELPPEIKEYEPEAAFNAGTFGLDIFNRIIKDAPDYLRSGGYLLFEVGLGQGDFLIKRLKKNKHYSSVEGVCDQNGNVRVLIIRAA